MGGNRNAFVKNVAVECDGYGFRLEPPGPEDGQADGAAAARVEPFLRFDANEAHSQRGYGMNLAGPHGRGPSDPLTLSGPDSRHPIAIRALRIWDCHWGFTPGPPGTLIDGLSLAHCDFGIYRANYDRHAYRGVSIYQCGRETPNFRGGRPTLRVSRSRSTRSTTARPSA